jgi:hypothetical protein
VYARHSLWCNVLRRARGGDLVPEWRNHLKTYLDAVAPHRRNIDDVDDFFDRPWVERFCGREAAQALANNLPRQDCRVLRAGLRDLIGRSSTLRAESTRPRSPNPTNSS